MVRDGFPLTWLKQQYSVLQQRVSTAFRRVRKPAGRLGTIGGSPKKDARWWDVALQYMTPLLILGGVLLAAMIIIKVPQRQVEPLRNLLENYKPGSLRQLEPKEYLKLEHDARKLENDARTTLVQAVGGAVALAGIFFAWRSLKTTERNIQNTQKAAKESLEASRETLELSRKGQIADRFTKAIEQLGASESTSKKLEIRLGGIYALEGIAKEGYTQDLSKESPDHYWPIMEVLTAYVREHAPWPPKDSRLLEDDLSPTEKSPEEQDELPLKPALDIQAILTVLGRRTHTYDKWTWWNDRRLNLGNTDLRGVTLRGAHLERANLRGARLERADLSEARLERADLRGAHLERAVLRGAQLEGADLTGAHLERANLRSAGLASANLTRAFLQGARLSRELWKQTNLVGDFPGANLQGARLQEANLQSAQLKGARNVTVAQLSMVKTLYQAQLDPCLLEQIQRMYPQLLEKPPG
jgi:Pentapeptide repeats (8 copies)